MLTTCAHSASSVVSSGNQKGTDLNLLERGLNTEITVLVIPIFKLVFYKCTLFGILVE